MFQSLRLLLFGILCVLSLSACEVRVHSMGAAPPPSLRVGASINYEVPVVFVGEWDRVHYYPRGCRPWECLDQVQTVYITNTTVIDRTKVIVADRDRRQMVDGGWHHWDRERHRHVGWSPPHGVHPRHHQGDRHDGDQRPVPRWGGRDPTPGPPPGGGRGQDNRDWQRGQPDVQRPGPMPNPQRVHGDQGDPRRDGNANPGRSNNRGPGPGTHDGRGDNRGPRVVDRPQDGGKQPAPQRPEKTERPAPPPQVQGGGQKPPPNKGDGKERKSGDRRPNT